MDRYGHLMPEVAQFGIKAIDSLFEDNSNK